MKKVCFITDNPASTEDLSAWIKERENIQISSWSYNDIAMEIVNQRANVFNTKTNENLADYDKVLVFKTMEHAKNHIFSALGCFARSHNLKMYDDEFSNNSGKLYEMFLFNEKGLPVPDTAFGPKDFMAKKLADFGGRAILKATHASKGKNNFMIQSKAELLNILSKNPNQTFILQKFIPNTGDWRIVVLDYKAKMALYRFRDVKSTEHRNNTSVGGDARIISLNAVDPTIRQLAQEASRAFKVKLSGADIVQDSETGQPYVLEVNRTPQLLTGDFYDDKFPALLSLIKDDN